MRVNRLTQRAEAAEAEIERIRAKIEEQGAAWLHLWNQKEELKARLAKVVEAAKSSPLVSYTPVDGEAIHVVPVSVVLAAAQQKEDE